MRGVRNFGTRAAGSAVTPRQIGRVNFNSFAPVPGFSCAGVHAGLKKNNILDMALFLSDRPCNAAALFTTNVFAAPPVIYDKQLIAKYSKVGFFVIALFLCF
jgi:N-acetylglutamate synthase/N-acetylornithine aminotransferase